MYLSDLDVIDEAACDSTDSILISRSLSPHSIAKHGYVCAIMRAMDGNGTTRLYDLLGGDENLRALVDRFYDLMDLEAGFTELRAMHPASLAMSRDKLYHFLSGWTGGPDLYTPRYGQAFLRARHLPFPIGTSARDQWLTCMLMAMQDLGLEEQKQEVLLEAFFRTADWMRNQPS